MPNIVNLFHYRSKRLIAWSSGVYVRCRSFCRFYEEWTILGIKKSGKSSVEELFHVFKGDLQSYQLISKHLTGRFERHRKNEDILFFIVQFDCSPVPILVYSSRFLLPIFRPFLASFAECLPPSQAWVGCQKYLRNLILLNITTKN